MSIVITCYRCGKPAVFNTPTGNTVAMPGQIVYQPACAEHQPDAQFSAAIHHLTENTLLIPDYNLPLDDCKRIVEKVQESLNALEETESLERIKAHAHYLRLGLDQLQQEKPA